MKWNDADGQQVQECADVVEMSARGAVLEMAKCPAPGTLLTIIDKQSNRTTTARFDPRTQGRLDILGCDRAGAMVGLFWPRTLLDDFMKPRALIVDDHELVRKGVALLLESEWEICGEAENGKEAVRKVRQLKPDLVILDITMPIMGGTAAAREIRRVAPETKIVLLSMHEPVTVQELGKLGHVDACITKNCSGEELLTAISPLKPSDSPGSR